MEGYGIVAFAPLCVPASWSVILVREPQKCLPQQSYMMIGTKKFEGIPLPPSLPGHGNVELDAETNPLPNLGFISASMFSGPCIFSVLHPVAYVA